MTKKLTAYEKAKRATIKAVKKAAAKRADLASKWRIIPDEKVRHVWANEDGSGETFVDPTYYADNGTPICSDEDSEFFDREMVYVRTEILP